jgi:hypothetical protein
MRSAIGLLTIALCTALACGPDDWDDLIDAQAGTRLRPIFRTTDDGARIHVGWQDTSLNTPCTFGPTPNGEYRCLPNTPGNEPWLYADAACTQLVLQDIWIPDGATVVRVPGDGCFDATFWEIGEPVEQLYYDQGGCTVFSNDPAHRVTALGHDAFVAAELKDARGTSRIVPLLLEGEDGSRQIFGGWDRKHDEQVRPALDDGGQLRWFGRWEPWVSTSYYADAGCTQAVAVAECVPTSVQPTTAREVDFGVCPTTLGHRSLGSEVQQIYTDGFAGCVATELYGARAWRVEDSLDDGDFALASIVEAGGERIRVDIYTNPEGEPFLASGHSYDREAKDVECNWLTADYAHTPTPGASFECRPQDAPILYGRYLDAACSSEIAERWSFEESCVDAPLYAYGDGMLAEVTGTSNSAGDYVLDDQGVCVSSPYEPPGGGGVGEFFRVGERMPAAQAVDVVEE